MWMFGSRTTVKKVRNLLTWFSHPPQLQHSPLTSPPLLPPYVRTSLMFKRTAALPHTFVKRPPLISWKKMEPNEDLAGNDFTYSQDTTTAFQELLNLVHTNTKQLPNVLSPKHYAALTQLPLTYPWARLVLDLKEFLLSFDRHLITCLIANHVQGNNTPHPGIRSSQVFSSISRSSSCLSSLSL